MFSMIMVHFVFGNWVNAEDWPQYRGPTGMGICKSNNLPIQWGGADSKNVLWKVPLPGTVVKGDPDHNQSCPIIWKDQIVVTTVFWPAKRKHTEFPEQHVSCYQLADGKLKWDRLVPTGPWKLTDLRGGYAAPTPCTDGERIYTLFGSSTLAAIDFQGEIIWQKEIPDWKDFDVAIGTSPVLYAGQLILLADRRGMKGTLTSYNPKTGKMLWEQKRTTTFSHTTPVFVENSGQAQMLIGAAGELQSLDPKTGEKNWWVKTAGDVTSPVAADGYVYSDSGRGGPGVYVDMAGKGDASDRVKWKIKHFPEGLSSPVIVGHFLYRLHNPGVLKCVELTSGLVQYSQRLEGVSAAASPIADPQGRIYFASAGTSYVLQAGREFKLLATNDLGEPSLAAAAVTDGKIILKGSKNLFCIGAK